MKCLHFVTRCIKYGKIIDFRLNTFHLLGSTLRENACVKFFSERIKLIQIVSLSLFALLFQRIIKKKKFETSCEANHTSRTIMQCLHPFLTKHNFTLPLCLNSGAMRKIIKYVPVSVSISTRRF